MIQMPQSRAIYGPILTAACNQARDAQRSPDYNGIALDTIGENTRHGTTVKDVGNKLSNH